MGVFLIKVMTTMLVMKQHGRRNGRESRLWEESGKSVATGAAIAGGGRRKKGR